MRLFEIWNVEKQMWEDPPTQRTDRVEVNGISRSIYNSENSLIAQTPEEQIAFWKWFGKSKVVDEHGRPQVVYRGDKIGKSHADFTGNVDGNYIQGNIFFSSQKYIAKGYTPHRTNSYLSADKMDHTHGLYSAYLKIEKPVVVNAKGKDWDSIPLIGKLKKSVGYSNLQIDDLALHIQKKGTNDGLIVFDVWDQFGDGDQLIVFNSNQIKFLNSI